MEKVLVKAIEVPSLYRFGMDIDFIFYTKDDKPIMVRNGTNRDGDLYHIGQISSNIDWAKHDAADHFKDELKELYPNGYEIEFLFGIYKLDE